MASSSGLGFPNFPANLHFNKTSRSRPLRFPVNPCRLIGISSAVVMHRALVVKAVESPESSNNTTGPLLPNTQDVNKVDSSNGSPLPNSPFPFFNNIPGWLRWIVGSLMFIAFPYYRKILTIEDTVDKTAKTVLDVVEKVAGVTEKVAEELAEVLPENSKLKQIALEVDKISEKIGEDAELVEKFIDKVDDVVDDVAAAVEPVIGGLEVIEGVKAASTATTTEIKTN